MEFNTDESTEVAPNVAYWEAQLKAYDSSAETWKKKVKRAWQEYTNDRSQGDNELSPRSYFPIFWACVRTIEPAFYSRTPVLVTQKQFKEFSDPVANLAAKCLEALGRYSIKTSGFDRAMRQFVMHFILADKATVRIVFEADAGEKEISREYYQPAEVAGPDGHIITQYTNQQGMPFNGAELIQENGQYYSPVIEPYIDHLACDCEALHYRDYRHNPNARNWNEINWMSFDTQLTRSEVENMFGSEVAEAVTFSEHKAEEDSDDTSNIPTLYATICEIWDKKRKKVYYLAKGYPELLKHKNNPDGKDPYGLKEFFPCAPFMIGTYGPDNLFSVPAYHQLRDLLEQIHGAFDRLRRLILALRKRGIFDASRPELAEINNATGEAQFIGIDNLGELLGPNGTLDKYIHFFPTDELAKGVVQLKTLLADFKQEVYDLWGIPDIYRGITDPNETLGAQQLKGKHMSVRFSVLQREVQRVARDVIELMCDLYLAKCPDFKLAEIMGVKFLPPQDQAIFPQALALLKSDKERCLRIEIETDSTITQNMNADIEQKNYLAKTFFEGVAALKDVAPPFLPVAAKAFQTSVDALMEGKQISQELELAISQMMQQAANPPPPPPDPEVMKIQARMQVEQMHAQAQIAIEQKKTEAQIYQDQLIAQNKMALDQQQAVLKTELAKVAAQLEQMKAQQSLQLEQQKAVLDAELARQQHEYDVIIKELELDLKSKQQAVEMLIKTMEQRSQSSVASEATSSPPLHINIETSKPGRRVAKIERDQDGNSIISSEDVE